MCSPIPVSGISTSTSIVPASREITFAGPSDASTSCIWSLVASSSAVKRLDALLAGALGEQLAERRPEPAALPVVDHRYRGLGLDRVVEADEAGDTDALAASAASMAISAS